MIDTYNRWGRRWCGQALALVVAGALAGGQRSAAQGRASEAGQTWEDPGSARLTVRPREMVRATKNPPAGTYLLESVPDYWVTVPPQCVGEHLCPLWVFIPNGNNAAPNITAEIGPVAVNNGIILLAPTAYYTRYMDIGLKEVFQRFAIDLDRIAISGHCISSGTSLRFAIDNLDIFNRAVGISPFDGNTAGLDPKDKRLQLFGDDGLAEHGFDDEVEATRARGYAVKRVTGWRRHEIQFENEDFLAKLLLRSWANPDQATWPKPQVVADPLPVLTVQAIRKLTAFWNYFMQEPDSIRVTARRAHLREVVLPGRQDVSLPMMDTPAMAALYPSVAADLKKASLTAAQHDAYRIAVAATVSPSKAIPLTPTLRQNLDFVEAYPDEWGELLDTGMWWTP